ncbi:MAG: hypothetical protein F6J90_20860 [Moorea sp. SIOASIH]|uniref:hypothetical protein n=1 Tax=Moorena sp. SIOASIH TaxID=2607817 RepID=UPI0013B810A8|nr:hypothetical protein [Moorena sp. SIOASIH]NEO38649.1 hypothetical protein [Moorena sp. SIOASIH]
MGTGGQNFDDLDYCKPAKCFCPPYKLTVPYSLFPIPCSLVRCRVGSESAR